MKFCDSTHAYMGNNVTNIKRGNKMGFFDKKITKNTLKQMF